MKSYNQPSKDGITSILDKLVLQMTGSELLQVIDLIKTTCSLPDEGNGPRYVYGISALSDFIGCSPSTIYSLKKEGVLDPAIVSRVGKRIVFDGPMARRLAISHKQETEGSFPADDYSEEC
ncbi:MAG: DUF3853 family protein [Bacteroidales bacterium]|nr:DUF3853 family protein [Bacteroidales bacterium]